MIKKIILSMLMLLVGIIAAWAGLKMAYPKPQSYENCLLERLDGNETQAVVGTITYACSEESRRPRNVPAFLCRTLRSSELENVRFENINFTDIPEDVYVTVYNSAPELDIESIYMKINFDNGRERREFELFPTAYGKHDSGRVTTFKARVSDMPKDDLEWSFEAKTCLI